jgi:hypothetical protein
MNEVIFSFREFFAKVRIIILKLSLNVHKKVMNIYVSKIRW